LKNGQRNKIRVKFEIEMPGLNLSPLISKTCLPSGSVAELGPKEPLAQDYFMWIWLNKKVNLYYWISSFLQIMQKSIIQLEKKNT